MLNSIAKTIVRDANIYVENPNLFGIEDYNSKFDALEHAAKEYSQNEYNIKIEIASDTVTLFDPSYSEEKIILTLSPTGDFEAEAIGFDIEEKSSE